MKIQNILTFCIPFIKETQMCLMGIISRLKYAHKNFIIFVKIHDNKFVFFNFLYFSWRFNRGKQFVVWYIDLSFLIIFCVLCWCGVVECIYIDEVMLKTLWYSTLILTIKDERHKRILDLCFKFVFLFFVLGRKYPLLRRTK